LVASQTSGRRPSLRIGVLADEQRVKEYEFLRARCAKQGERERMKKVHIYTHV